MYKSGKGLLQLVLAFEPFMKWGLDYMGPIKLITCYTRNQYIIITTNYTKSGWKQKHYEIIQPRAPQSSMKTLLHSLVVLPTWLVIKKTIL
jgi:hypothetical protein